MAMNTKVAAMNLPKVVPPKTLSIIAASPANNTNAQPLSCDTLINLMMVERLLLSNFKIKTLIGDGLW